MKPIRHWKNKDGHTVISSDDPNAPEPRARRWETIGFVLWLIIGTTALQTMFDLYDPAHCLIVCPEKP